jgi:4-hydroxymandelate oxidase
MRGAMVEPISVLDYEEVAREKLTAMAYDYYASGAYDEVTLRENVAAYTRLSLRYRVLVDVSKRDLSTTVLGTRLAMPILVAPTAFHKMACLDGEIATARAAGQMGTIMTLSSLSNTAVEDVVAAATGPIWFQLYIYKDRGATAALVKRAQTAGAKAIVVTVDAPLLGRRERDVRNRFCLPAGLAVENMVPAGYGDLPAHPAESGLATYVATLLDQALKFEDIGWLRSITSLPVLIKGVVRGDDAKKAVDHGASAIVVSNHGGRQLDTSVATIDALEEVVQAVDGRAEVLLDGGVRRGTDVIKALALGARAVLVGRPILWGLAAAGEAGARDVLGILRAELDLAMALCGAPDVSAVTRDLVQRRA